MCGGMDIGGCPSFREEGPPPLRCRTGPPLPPLPRGYGPTPRVEAPRKVIFPPFRLLKTVTFFCPKKYPMWHFFCQISRVFSPALHSHWTKNQPFWQFHCSEGLPPSLTGGVHTTPIPALVSLYVSPHFVPQTAHFVPQIIQLNNFNSPEGFSLGPWCCKVSGSESRF